MTEGIPELYPEHDRLAKVRDESNRLGNFMEWLQQHGYADIYGKFSDILADYFRIDQEKLEAEKQQILADIRAIKDMGGVE